MKVFLVYAHPEKRSFNAALHVVAVNTLREYGHEVVVSDLYEMDFEPVASTRDFLKTDQAARARFREEQRKAYQEGILAADILREQEKLIWCDLLIFQFPLWWFSMPAIMKGWVDRVLTPGFAYSRTMLYNHGGLRGKKALILLTTGGSKIQSSYRGMNGPIEAILFPIHHGILYYVGFDVLPPFIAWQPSRLSEAQREHVMERLRHYLECIPTFDPIPLPVLEDADQSYQITSSYDWSRILHFKLEKDETK